MKKCRGGFTLIELLVVIAILAILASILFPVFAQTREQAKVSKCMSNLKQLGTACVMYTDDWKGFYPYPGGNTATLAWDQDTNGGLDAYMKNKSAGTTVWRCPDAIAPPPGQQPTAGTSFASLGRSYAMSDYIRPYNRGRNNWPISGLNVAQIQLSSQCILIFETHQLTDATAYRNGSPHFRDGTGGEPVCMHNGKMDVVFCDTHVQRVFPPDTWSRFTPTGGPNRGVYRPKQGAKTVTVQGNYPSLPDMWMPYEGFQNYPSQ